MSGSYRVLKSTTDQLQNHLDGALQDDLDIHIVQWVGGRDWIIICQAQQVTDLPSAMAAAIAHSPEASGWTWATDLATRHRQLDDLGPEYFEQKYHDVPAAAFYVIPEMEWGNIRYGRYDETRIDSFTGWIEDTAKSWIIFLGAHGAPSLYWPRRDSQGGVIGAPIELTS